MTDMSEQQPKGESFAALFEGAVSHAPRRHSFAPGEEMDVVVVQIGRDAVFVELDGKQEGFIEAKDLSNKAGELTVKIGSRVRARVVEVGGRPGAVRLLPVLVRPPVAEEADAEPVMVEGAAGSTIMVGATVRGSVVGIERYGVFLQLGASGAAGTKRPPRGLVPVAELGFPRGADLHKLLPLGTELDAKVTAIDERSRIRLSVVALRADTERREFEAFEQKSKIGGGTERAKGFGTLGDLLTRRK
jgi:small subunit ribosomal protein S1